MDLMVYKGVPIQFEKTLRPHQNFINKVKFNPSGTVLASVSADKSLSLIDSTSWEEVSRVDKAHDKGIMDVCWLDDEKLVTCSSDNKVKVWVKGEAIKCLTVSED